MDILFLLTSTLFYIWIIRNILFWLHLWQIKEGRLDRLVIHLRETIQGRQILFGWGNILKLLAFFLYFAIIFSNTQLLSLYHYMVFFIFLMEGRKVVLELTRRTIKVPTMTAKTIFMLVSALLFAVLLYIFPILDKFFWLVFLDRINLGIIWILTFVTWLPSDIYKDYLIKKALAKFEKEKSKKLIIIGVTGSYGKGSTKEYIATILSQKFNVLKTPGTFNTPIGIAKTILDGPTSKTQIFVVEMGAYKRGEIREMCAMVRPRIGVLTAVNNQHLSLFGNIANTRRAKYELIESLPRNGFSMFNGSNDSALSLYKKTRKKKILYFSERAKKSFGKLSPDIIASNIEVSRFFIAFRARAEDRDFGEFRAKLIGGHHVENLLPGIFLGFYLGMSFGEIKSAIFKITPQEATMEPFKTASGVVIIDDTFNANPASVLAAVDYMNLYRGKKVLVLQPMIELGKKAGGDHYEVAREIGKVCNYLILTNRNFHEQIEQGIEDSGGLCKVMTKNPGKIAQFVENNLKRGSIVVFEGKEAAVPLSLIEREKIE